MPVGIAFPGGIGNLAKRRFMRPLSLVGSRIVGGQLRTGREANHQFVLAGMEPSLQIENGRHKGIGGLADPVAVHEHLSVEIEAIEHQLLTFVAEKIFSDLEGGPIPPGLGFRPTAVGHVGSKGRFRHLSGLHQVQVDFSRHLRRQPAFSCLPYLGQPRLAGALQRLGPYLPGTVEADGGSRASPGALRPWNLRHRELSKRYGTTPVQSGIPGEGIIEARPGNHPVLRLLVSIDPGFSFKVSRGFAAIDPGFSLFLSRFFVKLYPVPSVRFVAERAMGSPDNMVMQKGELALMKYEIQATPIIWIRANADSRSCIVSLHGVDAQLRRHQDIGREVLLVSKADQSFYQAAGVGIGNGLRETLTFDLPFAPDGFPRCLVAVPERTGKEYLFLACRRGGNDHSHDHRKDRGPSTSHDALLLKSSAGTMKGW